jgi:hypothetical protein
LPYSSLIGLNALSDTIALIPLGWLVEQGLGLDDVGLVVVFVCAGAFAVLLVPRGGRSCCRWSYSSTSPSRRPRSSRSHQQSLESLFGGISRRRSPQLDRPEGGLEREGGRDLDREHDKFTIRERDLQPQRRHRLRDQSRRPGDLRDAGDDQPRSGSPRRRSADPELATPWQTGRSSSKEGDRARTRTRAWCFTA